MTEFEYDIEILCCLPKSVLERCTGEIDSDIPCWVKTMDSKKIQYAIEHYEDDYYKYLRNVSINAY